MRIAISRTFRYHTTPIAVAYSEATRGVEKLSSRGFWHHGEDSDIN